MTDTGETMGLRDAVWLAIWDWLGKQRASPYDLVDAILALPQLAAQQARIVELEAALEPFAKVADHYDPANPDGSFTQDTFPLRYYRLARAALRKDPQQ